MLACPHHRSETFATLWCVGSRHVNPSPPEHRVTGRIRPCPPPRAITRRRTRCQSYGKDEGGHPSSHVPIRAERSTPSTVSHNVNTALLQCAPNLFNLLLVHTTNANTTVNITLTVLKNFELKRDTVQTKNDFPAQ